MVLRKSGLYLHPLGGWLFSLTTQKTISYGSQMDHADVSIISQSYTCLVQVATSVVVHVRESPRLLEIVKQAQVSWN